MWNIIFSLICLDTPVVKENEEKIDEIRPEVLFFVRKWGQILKTSYTRHFDIFEKCKICSLNTCI